MALSLRGSKKYKMEEIAKHITINVSHAVEILAAVIIGIAVIKTLSNYFNGIKKPKQKISKEEKGKGGKEFS